MFITPIRTYRFILLLPALAWGLVGRPAGAQEIPITNAQLDQSSTSSRWFVETKHDDVLTGSGVDVVTSWDVPVPSGVKSNATTSTTATQVTSITNNTFTTLLQGGAPLAFDGTVTGGAAATLRVTDPTANQTITLPNASGEISLLGQAISGSEVSTGAILLGDKTSGDYVAGITAGNGVSLGGTSGEGATASVGLGNLSANWLQGGAFDLVLGNTKSELKILGTDGSHYLTLDAGSLASDATFTFSGGSGTVLTTGNFSASTGGLLVTNNLSDLDSAASARTNLGLGSLATESASGVAITGGSITGITDLTVADGGTGLSTVPTSGQLLIGNGTGYTVGSISGTGITAVTNGSGSITIASTEADTLAAVTGRGATTSTALTLSNAANSLTAGTLTVTGGTVNGVTIGGTTPGLGTFTTFSATGTTTLGSGAGNTTSIGNTTGTVQIESTGLDVSTAGALSGITGFTQGSGNVAISGVGTLSTGTGAISLNGDATVAAGKNLALASGTGTFTQSFTATTGTAATLNITNAGTSGSNVVKGVVLNLTGTNNGTGTNTITGLDFGTVAAATNNSYTGLNLGTGWTNFLDTPTIDISGAGAITGLTGLTLASGNIAVTGTGTLSTGTGAVSLNGDTTVASGKILAVTSGDGLTVGGNILPQTLFVPVGLAATLLDSTVFVADASYQLTSTRCTYALAALSGGTLQVRVETGTAAPGTGTAQLTGTLDLSSTINTTLAGTVVGSPTTIAPGDRISLDLGGTLTNLLGFCTLGLKRV
ncbi:MAG: hypothetical protein AAB515_03385 [Patescibacteria group bacterium]